MRPHLLHVFPAFGHGGPEVRTALIVNATADRYRHTILSISGDLSGRDRVRENGDTRLGPVPRPVGWGGPARGLARAVAELRPDLLLTYGWGGVDAILAGRLCGHRRIIHTEDGFLPDEAHGQKWRRLLARQLLLRAAAKVVCPSQTLVDIAGRLWRLPRRLVYYLPNGVDAARFSPGTPAERAAARRRFGLGDADVVVGTVGHLRAEKNQARLIRAFAQLPGQPPAKLLVVGDGNLRPALERQARDLGLAGRVVFTGVLPDPGDCYRALDLFALSSDTEQMPIAVLEAMSAGLAVVSTDVGDVREMIGAANRPYVTPLGDDEAYARALAALVSEPQERAALGRANRARGVEVYDLSTMVERYDRLYEEVLDGRRPTSGGLALKPPRPPHVDNPETR
jgi:glycosyltransferase involved in cell wall biosynthesis